MLNKNYIYLAIGLLIGYIIHRLLRRSVNSNYAGYANVAVYNFKNGTAQPKTVKLFSSVYAPPSGVTVTPSTIDLQAEVMNIPKQVGNIRIRSSNVNQIESPIVYKCQSATGTSNSQVINPRVSPTQAQSNVVDAPIENVMLDGRCYFEYTILPNTEVTWSISYNDLRPQYSTEQSLAKEQQYDVQSQGQSGQLPIAVSANQPQLISSNNTTLIVFLAALLVVTMFKNN